MHKMFPTLTIAFLLFLLSCATPEPVTVTQIVEQEVTRIVEVTAEPSPSYTVDTFDTQQYVELLESVYFDEPFRVYTVLPLSYDTETDKSYPVLYVTDGNYDTDLADTIIQNLRYQRAVPEVIIVGIGYDTNADAEIMELRRDLLPSSSETEEGAAELLAFLTEELIPHVDSSYRTNPLRRFLAGFSAGGTFAIYTMLNTADLFEGFVATSPGLAEFEGWSLFDEVERYVTTHDDLPANLYMSIGKDEEGQALYTAFEDKLRSQGFASFKMKSDVFEGENHLTMWMVGMQRGLREIFIARSW